MLEQGERDRRTGAVAAQIRFAADPLGSTPLGSRSTRSGWRASGSPGRPVGEAAKPCDVFGASGAVALLRRGMLAEAGRDGGVLLRLPRGRRSRVAGACGRWRAVYEPGAIALHRGSASSGPAGRRSSTGSPGATACGCSRATPRPARSRRLCPRSSLYDCAYVLYVAISDRTFAPLQGRLRGLRGWRAARRRGAASRREVALGSAWRGWRGALRMHRAYRELAR